MEENAPQKIRDELMTELWKGGERVTFLNDAQALNLEHGTKTRKFALINYFELNLWKGAMFAC